AWRAAGARALFFFILDKGKVRKEDLTLAFWPDFSQAQVNSNLHATLWRARRALGDKSFIQIQGGYYRLRPDLQIRYDVRDFENLLQQARQTNDDETRIAFYRDAARLYQGDFLSDLDLPWIEERRAELQRRYRETLDALIEWHMQHREYRQAMDWLSVGLRLEPYLDTWHLYWMQCLAATGSPSAARAYYLKYRKRLRRELNVEPDEALQTFYRQLKPA
ncbi:MAG: hypothetical protein GXO56_04670, partial [Chloroflexi bacterium]|nr:hypothetical protein [Chloroflexota bacterium]